MRPRISINGSVRPSVRPSVGWLVGWSVTLESKSGKTRISAPAHPSATGIGRVSGLVFLFLPSPDFETATEWSGLDVLGRIKLGSEGVPGEEGSLTFR